MSRFPGTIIPADKKVLCLEKHPTDYYFWEEYALEA